MKIRLRTPLNEVRVKPVSWSKVNLGKLLITTDNEELDESKTYGYYEDLDTKDDISLSIWNKGFISVNQRFPFFEVNEKTDTSIDDFMKKKNRILINLYGRHKWDLIDYGKEGEQFNTNNLSQVSGNRHAIISIRKSYKGKDTHFYCLKLKIESELLLNRIHKFESPNLIVRTNGQLLGMEEDNNIQFTFLNDMKQKREVYKELTITA